MARTPSSEGEPVPRLVAVCIAVLWPPLPQVAPPQSEHGNKLKFDDDEKSENGGGSTSTPKPTPREKPSTFVSTQNASYTSPTTTSYSPSSGSYSITSDPNSTSIPTKALLVSSRKSKSSGKWVFPKGGVEIGLGEDEGEAARREIWEEAGVRAPTSDHFLSLPSNTAHPRSPSSVPTDSNFVPNVIYSFHLVFLPRGPSATRSATGAVAAAAAVTTSIDDNSSIWTPAGRSRKPSHEGGGSQSGGGLTSVPMSGGTGSSSASSPGFVTAATSPSSRSPPSPSNIRTGSNSIPSSSDSSSSSDELSIPIQIDPSTIPNDPSSSLSFSSATPYSTSNLDYEGYEEGDGIGEDDSSPFLYPVWPESQQRRRLFVPFGFLKDWVGEKGDGDRGRVMERGLEVVTAILTSKWEKEKEIA